MLTEGLYEVVGRANNGDYMLRQAPIGIPSLDTQKLPITLNGSRNCAFKIGEAVYFDDALGRFVRWIGREVIYQDNRFSSYRRKIQELSSKIRESEAVVAHDQYWYYWTHFVIVARTKEKVVENVNLIKDVTSVQDIIDSNVVYNGSNGLVGTIYNTRGILFVRLKSLDGCVIIPLHRLDDRLERELMFHEKDTLEFLVESINLK